MPAGSDEEDELEEEKPKKKAPAKKPASEKKAKAAKPESKQKASPLSSRFVHFFKHGNLQADVEMDDGEEDSQDGGSNKKRKVSDRSVVVRVYLLIN